MNYYDVLEIFPQVKKFRNKVIEKIDGRKILDLCTGTGAIALLIAKKFPESQIYGLDISRHMLRKAGKKAGNLANILFIEADAQKIPFESDSLDVIIVSFGLHEMPGEMRSRALAEIARVLKRDGRIVLIDYEKPKNFLARYLLYLFLRIFEPKHALALLDEQLEDTAKTFGISAVEESHSFIRLIYGKKVSA
ncbi:MAG: class I SAM-dependent methyltransferase [Euryarchaeota archaeon]|nr:class I SAM-dependent methyltransferase [Euryarchaeota archaeon]